MPSSKAWIFERRRHGRSGHCGFRVGFGDHRRVAAVQRCGADLLPVQPGDPKTGARPFYPQPDVLQPVAERVQHAPNSGRARHRWAPRRRRLLPDRGFPRHFPHHELHAQHGSAQHRQMGGGGVPAELPLQDTAPGRGDGAGIHVDTLTLLRHRGHLPLLGRVPPPLRVVHSLQCQGEGSRDALCHFHRGFPLSHFPAHADRAVRNVSESAESCEVSL